MTQSAGVGLMLSVGLGSTYNVAIPFVPNPGLKSLCLWYVLVPGVAVPGASNSLAPQTERCIGKGDTGRPQSSTLADMSRKGWWGQDKGRTCRGPCVPYQGLHLLPLAQEEMRLYSARLPVCPLCCQGQEKGEVCEGTNTYSQQGKERDSWQPLWKDSHYAWTSLQPVGAKTIHICEMRKLREA